MLAFGVLVADAVRVRVLVRVFDGVVKLPAVSVGRAIHVRVMMSGVLVNVMVRVLVNGTGVGITVFVTVGESVVVCVLDGRTVADAVDVRVAGNGITATTLEVGVAGIRDGRALAAGSCVLLAVGVYVLVMTGVYVDGDGVKVGMSPVGLVMLYAAMTCCGDSADAYTKKSSTYAFPGYDIQFAGPPIFNCPAHGAIVTDAPEITLPFR